MSCHQEEDSGALQAETQTYALGNFTQIAAGNDFNLTINQGNTFKISVDGDRRNIDDLEVTKSGSSLLIRYTNNRKRKHTTFITVTMPSLEEVNFSGGTYSTINGFGVLSRCKISLSGGATSNIVGMEVDDLIVELSGGSILDATGNASFLEASLSGGAQLRAFNLLATKGDIVASGGANARININEELKANATGGAWIHYRGTPLVTSKVSGGGDIRKD